MLHRVFRFVGGLSVSFSFFAALKQADVAYVNVLVACDRWSVGKKIQPSFRYRSRTRRVRSENDATKSRDGG